MQVVVNQKDNFRGVVLHLSKDKHLNAPSAMLKVILVDDETQSLEAISTTLKLYFPDVEVLAAFDNPFRALEELPLLKPDLVFLDIEMPGMNGLELAPKIAQQGCEVIFVTAFNQYAVNAIKLSALDYLMKPVEIAELEAAIQKAVSKIKTKQHLEQFKVLANLLSPESGRLPQQQQKQKIALPTTDSIIYVNMENIVRIEASQNYCEFYFTDSKKMVVSKNIGIYEESLDPYHFMRIHRSHIINLVHVKEFVRHDGGIVKMLDGTPIEVSRQKRDELLERLERI